MHESDAKLVERCLAGNAQSWEHLLQAHSRRLFNIAYRYTGRIDVAEELTQEIFLKVYQKLSKFNPQAGSLSNWMMRVGRNLIIDYYRANRSDKTVAGSPELEELELATDTRQPGPFENLHQKERAEYLMKGMDRLTTELREAVLLRDMEGFTYQEIADLLRIPVGTVKSRINRGRIELSRLLIEEVSPGPEGVTHA